MANHYQLLNNVSLPNMVRGIKDFLTSYSTDDTTVGLMWTVVTEVDDDPTNEFYTGPIVYVLAKDVDSAGNKIYAKIVYELDTIKILVSPNYNSSTDNTGELKLQNSQKNELEDDNGVVNIYTTNETLLTPLNAKVCRIIMPATFDPATQRINKVWFVRKLGPLFDSPEIVDRKDTDLFFWLSFSIEESVSGNPLNLLGYFHHLSFGAVGEILTADTQVEHGVGFYTAAGSFALDSARANIDKRTYCGGSDTPDTAGCCVCIGDWNGKRTWYYPATMYGYARDPFDLNWFSQYNANVGFDFTEMCKFSPYAGVRILTPSYVFGLYRGLWRIICRLPFFYTDLTGLYAGDIVTHTDDDGNEQGFMIFPFVHYGCDGSIGSRRGYAVPLDLT